MHLLLIIKEIKMFKHKTAEELRNGTAEQNDVYLDAKVKHEQDLEQELRGALKTQGVVLRKLQGSEYTPMENKGKTHGV